MEKYVIIRAKAFQSLEKFQKSVNEQAAKGYKAISICGPSGTHVLMEKISHE